MSRHRSAYREIGEPDPPDCTCFHCREGDPDGPNPPAPDPTMPNPIDIEGDER